MTTPNGPRLHVWSATGAHDELARRLGRVADQIGRSIHIWDGRPDAFHDEAHALLVLSDVDSDDAGFRARVAELDPCEVAAIVLLACGDGRGVARIPAVILALPEAVLASDHRLVATFGLLGGLDTTPRHDADILATVLQFFASRAAAEIARERHHRKLESLNTELEARIEERTRELERAQARLVETAHRAGMADMAVNVMHNVGNMLNAVISASDAIHDLSGTSAFHILSRVTELLREQDDLAAFMTQDERGQRIPELLTMVRDALDTNLRAMSDEAARIRHAADLIDGVVKLQHRHTQSELGDEDTVVAELLDDLVAVHQRACIEHDVALDIECDPGLELHVNRIKLLHLTHALLQNAIEAIGRRPASALARPGRIALHTEADQDEVRIHVSDNGVGIASDQLEAVFQPGVTSKENGLGLGLHNAACAAVEMGGHIAARSPGPGQGARFTIHLPRRPG